MLGMFVIVVFSAFMLVCTLAPLWAEGMEQNGCDQDESCKGSGSGPS
jgi:hypothetical protein